GGQLQQGTAGPVVRGEEDIIPGHEWRGNVGIVWGRPIVVPQEGAIGGTQADHPPGGETDDLPLSGRRDSHGRTVAGRVAQGGPLLLSRLAVEGDDRSLHAAGLDDDEVALDERGTGDAPSGRMGLELLQKVVAPKELRLAARRGPLKAEENTRGADGVN